MPDHEIQDPRDAHRWVVLGVISSVYLLVYFHRVSTSVIVPDLLAAFDTQAAALGFMSSMYFSVYALEQPVVGYLSDRLGPRRVVGFWTLAAALGCVIFGLAPTIGWASVGRGLIGFGVGGVYVPAMKAFSQWFRKREFATLTGLLLAAGNLGAVIATTPLAWMAKEWGWRWSFQVIAAVTLVLAVAALTLLRDHNGDLGSGSAGPAALQDMGTGSLEAAWQVLTSPRFWTLFAIFFGFFGTYLTFQGLWITPYLMSMFGLDRMFASELTMATAVGFMVGAPVIGWLADRVFHDRVRILTNILLVKIVIWCVLIWGGTFLGSAGMAPVLFVMGVLAGGFATALWAIVRETTPEPVMGITTGLLNPSPFLGVAVFQVVTGAVLDRVGRTGGIYPPEAFRDAFLVCLVSVLACLALCVGLKKHLYGGKAQD